jgi:hypothetical protein
MKQVVFVVQTSRTGCSFSEDLGELALSSCGLGFEYVLCFGLFLLVVMEDPLKGSTAGVTKVLVLDK